MAAVRREPPQSGTDTVMTGALSHRGGCGPGFRAGPGWPAGLPGPAFPAGTECTWPRVLQQRSPRVLQQRSLQRKRTHVASIRFRSRRGAAFRGKEGSRQPALPPSLQQSHTLATSRRLPRRRRRPGPDSERGRTASGTGQRAGPRRRMRPVRHPGAVGPAMCSSASAHSRKAGPV